jgi:hypothetical protein
MRVKTSEDFRIAYKRLKKRHKSLQQDFERLLESLLLNPMQGVELDGGARKVRLAITSKGRGKSGGARVIIRVRIVADELQLLYIYDKADYENVSDVFLCDIMKRMETAHPHTQKKNIRRDIRNRMPRRISLYPSLSQVSSKQRLDRFKRFLADRRLKKRNKEIKN